MKQCFLAAATLSLALSAFALDEDPFMHDPSTVVESEGKFFSYGTGMGLPISYSDDGWSWRRAGSAIDGLPGGSPGQAVIALGGNNTWAPDIIHVGDKY